MNHPSLVFVCSLLCLVPACVHNPLRRNVLRQARTLTDVYEQQVLDNIALAIAAPGSTPFFALPKGGSTQVINNAGSTAGLGWNPTTFTGGTLGFSGSGSLSENWTLEPVTNPDRLNLLSCLLLHVCCKEGSQCQECDTKLSTFFGDTYPSCLPSCFFCYGNKLEVPKHCAKVGRHDDLYVWVTPQHYLDLQTTTLAMLDIVTADLDDFSEPDTKTVTVTQRFKSSSGAELEGEFKVTPEAYEAMQSELRKTQGLKSSNNLPDNLSPTIISPSNSFAPTRPMFRSRKESSGGPTESLLLQPRP